MKKISLCFCLLISLQAIAKSLCFSSLLKRDQALSKIMPYLLPKDGLRKERNCLSFAYISPGREELLEKLTKKDFTLNVRTLKSEQLYKNKMCKISIEKKISSKGNKLKTKLGVKFQIKNGQNARQRMETSQMIVMIGRPANLIVDDLYLELICMPKGSKRFEIELRLHSDRITVQTTIMVEKGFSMEIGQNIEKLKDRARELSIQKGLDFSKFSKQRVTSIKLKVL